MAKSFSHVGHSPHVLSGFQPCNLAVGRVPLEVTNYQRLLPIRIPGNHVLLSFGKNSFGPGAGIPYIIIETC